MYYVTVIALSHHVSVVMCFVHIIIIIIIISGGLAYPLGRIRSCLRPGMVRGPGPFIVNFFILN